MSKIQIKNDAKNHARNSKLAWYGLACLNVSWQGPVHLSSHAVCLVIKLTGVRTGHSYLVFFVDLFYDMHCHLLKLFFFQFQVRIIENTNVKRKPFYNTPSKQLTPWCCTSQDLASRAVLGIYIVLLNLSGGRWGCWPPGGEKSQPIMSATTTAISSSLSWS